MGQGTRVECREGKADTCPLEGRWDIAPAVTAVARKAGVEPFFRICAPAHSTLSETWLRQTVRRMQSFCLAKPAAQLSLLHLPKANFGRTALSLQMLQRKSEGFSRVLAPCPELRMFRRSWKGRTSFCARFRNQICRNYQKLRKEAKSANPGKLAAFFLVGLETPSLVPSSVALRQPWRETLWAKRRGKRCVHRSSPWSTWAGQGSKRRGNTHIR